MGSQVDVDLHHEKNKVAHHTDMFCEDALIVRRGQPFLITVRLQSDKNLTHTFSEAKLITQTGVSSQTRVSMDLNGGKQDCGWSTSASQSGKTVSLTICPPPNAPIGKYTLVLSERSNNQTLLGKFILLFNPWCPDDSVYMEMAEQRDEYIMSQDGIIFKGEANNISSWAWNYGQFESGILNISLKILNKSLQHKSNPDKDCCNRNDPIYVTRVLSAMINSNDDSGVLTGKWTGSYSSGVEPTKWTGSVEILRKWNDCNCQSVRYGQCWVFAGVGCTVARALGIPCRVITNFQSAHDTNGDLKIEMHVTENNIRMNESVWNFHCWLENWMKRPDLKPGYDGWQASDPTPQEQSEGVMCCGPVPVKAIKEGDLTCKYDAAFVYAEVNADIITKYQLNNGRMLDVVNKVHVGQHISTKSIGKDTREDVTHLYKHQEGSELERESYRNAQVCQDFDLSFESPGQIKKGSDFVLYVVVTNKSSAVKKIKLQVSSDGVLHNGHLDRSTTQPYLGKHSLIPGEVLKVSVKHQYINYCSLLCTGSQILVSALLTDMGSMAIMIDKHTIILQDPEISIQIVGQPKVGQQSCVKLSVKNPLPETLHECRFTIQGANLTNGEPLTRRIAAVSPGQEARVKLYFTPTQSGSRKLMVDFYSQKLGHVKAYTNLYVQK